MRYLLITIIALFTLPCMWACQPGSEPIERVKQDIKELVIPIAEKGMEELSTSTAQIQGQLSGINPGYVLDGYGLWGTGIIWQVRVKTDGLSGNIAGATQADKGPKGPGVTEIPAPTDADDIE